MQVVSSLPSVEQRADVRLSTPPPTARSDPNVAASSAIAAVSPAGQLMSKLSQLSTEDPAKFKHVTGAIARQLAASATQQQDLAKQSALTAELARVERSQSTTATTAPSTITVDAAPPSPQPDTGAHARNAVIAAFTDASTTGTIGPSAAAVVVSWTESALVGAISSALARVNQELGLTGSE